jgi:hypothetical protein
MILSYLILLIAENVHIAMSLLVGAHTVAEQPNDSLGSLVALHFQLCPQTALYACPQYEPGVQIYCIIINNTVDTNTRIMG